MATPPSKRDQRREERKASTAGNQAARTPSTGGSKAPKSPASKPTGASAKGAATTGKSTGGVKAAARGTQGNDQDTGNTRRDQRREARRATFEERRAENQRRLQAAKTREAIRRLTFIGGVIVAVALLFLIIHFTTSGSSHTPVISSGYGQGITCDTTEGSVAHYHANLQIVVDGKKEAVPADVGIIPNQQCLYWLHTHDTSGVIHVETPNANRTYYLGDFFAIWSKTVGQSGSIAFGPPALSTTSFFGHPVDANHPLTVYINGRLYQGDPNKIVIKSGENIWLEYAKPLLTPTPYDFVANGVSP